MKRVGNLCETLLAPATLRTALTELGNNEHFASKSVLFNAGDKNAGVFLVSAGQVRLDVPGAPKLSRTFSTGSLLGLPSTFSEKPYNLTAVSASDSAVIHVNQKKFLDLMKNQPDLCRQATDILTREIAFIFSALRGKPKSPLGNSATTRSPQAVNE